MTYCGPRFLGVVGDDPVELELRRSPEYRLLDPGCRIRRRTSFAGGVAGPHPACCAMVFSGVQVARWLSLGLMGSFGVLRCFWLLEMSGAYGVFQGYVYTSPGIPAFHHV